MENKNKIMNGNDFKVNAIFLHLNVTRYLKAEKECKQRHIEPNSLGFTAPGRFNLVEQTVVYSVTLWFTNRSYVF